MAVFRVDKSRDYTVMSNHHLKNRDLSLKAMGLLSKILSLPEDWDYTTRGLAAICKEGVGSIGAALKELELAGYIQRTKLRDTKGRITDIEYVIYEQPQLPDTVCPDTDYPDTENPYMDSRDTDFPCTDISLQLITKVTKEKNNKILTESNTHSIPFPSGETTAARPLESKGNEAMLREMGLYREIIRENISYDMLRQDMPTSVDRLDEIVELITETICSKRKTIRVSGNDFPHDTVKSRLLKLDSEHIRFVFDCLRENTSKV